MGSLKTFLKKIRHKYRESFFMHFPISHKKIVFCNFLGKGFGCNPRYIAEALHAKKPELDLVWLCTDPKKEKFPPYIRPVKMRGSRGIYEIITAKALVTNVRNALTIHKRPGQIHLQTWHGCGAVKLVEKQIEHKLSPTYLAGAKRDGQIADGILVANSVQENLFKEFFWLADSVELLRTGLPRNDAIIKYKNDTEYLTKVRSRLGISADKLILYAPTFRDDGSLEGYSLDFSRIIEAFHQKDGKEWRILLRLHPNAARLVHKLSLGDKVIDVTAWPDINELIHAADVCITDYSSVMYDFMLLNKPVFLFMTDFEKYKNDRGIVNDFYDLPFNMSYNNNDLVEYINIFDKNNYKEKLKEYMKKNPSYDHGDASEKVATWLLKKMNCQ